MATRSFALATVLMPLFQENVLRRMPRTYGYYAAHAGLDVAKESILIGKAMHAIGAACVMTRTPIAPLHYVERASPGTLDAERIAAALLVVPRAHLCYVLAHIHSPQQHSQLEDHAPAKAVLRLHSELEWKVQQHP